LGRLFEKWFSYSGAAPWDAVKDVDLVALPKALAEFTELQRDLFLTQDTLRYPFSDLVDALLDGRVRLELLEVSTSSLGVSIVAYSCLSYSQLAGRGHLGEAVALDEFLGYEGPDGW